MKKKEKKWLTGSEKDSLAFQYARKLFKSTRLKRICKEKTRNFDIARLQSNFLQLEG